MTRRGWLLGLAAALRADDSAAIEEWLERLALFLTEENPGDFLKRFRRDMEGRGTLEANVRGLVQSWEVTSSLKVLDVAGEGPVTAKIDWFLELRPRLPAVRGTQRRQTLEFRLERQKKGWLVTQFAAVDFFAPPSP